MSEKVWARCLADIKEELPGGEFNTWVLPLQLIEKNKDFCLLAPNKYIKDMVERKYLLRIKKTLTQHRLIKGELRIEIGGDDLEKETPSFHTSSNPNTFATREKFFPLLELNKEFTFDSFVEGRSNQLARAAALQVSENVGGASYNPLLLYGGVGLGKTHLMHAVGNSIAERHPSLKVAYMYSQRFMEDMVRAIERGKMADFTQYYRTVNVLLMDDIQFLAKGMKTQEEFFHVFNRLQEDGSQIVLTCDRYPKEIEGLEERLESRFVWGMTAPVEPPELETRVAILMKKAELEGVLLPSDTAFFLGERIRSNVRELEGALKRVIANAKFTGREINIEQARDALRDLIAIQDRQVSIENIQKTVADYYKVRVGELNSKRRTRSIARPRQLAMAISKAITTHSLPEIGDSFGGRDHTTVLHACRKIEELRECNTDIREDYNNLVRMLTS